MSQERTLNDALLILQCAMKSLSDKKEDGHYCLLLNTVVVSFIQRLSKDTNLPLTYFSPVSSTIKPEKAPSDYDFQPRNPQLTFEATQAYWNLVLII